MRYLMCYECKHWETSDFIMNKYGEGCGRCTFDRGNTDNITSCTHKCTIGEPIQEENKENYYE